MATELGRAAAWPLELETFDPERWGPVPGATLETCRCAHCVERFGAALPADDSTDVEDARRRWREARIEFLTETLGRGHPATKMEIFEAIRRASGWTGDVG
jgi:hypothetical protein